MRYRAALAWRSPPRFKRRRTVLPEDTWTGLAPDSAAEEASLPSRSGLSPAVMSRAAAQSGPTPGRASSLAVWRLTARASCWLSSSISPVSSRIRQASSRSVQVAALVASWARSREAARTGG